MKKRSFLILLLSLFFISCYWVYNNSSTKEILIQTITYTVLKQEHYEKINFDDSLSNKIFEEFITMLDPDNLFFLKSDIKNFEKYRYSITDEIKQGSLDFFEKVYSTYLKRLEEAEKIYEEVVEQNFDFNKKEYINVNEEWDFAKNKAQLEDKWRKFIKYQILIKLEIEQRKEKNKQKKDSTYKPLTFEQMIDSAKNEVKDIFNNYFERLKERDREDIFSLYMIAFTTSIDPHTFYMAPKIQENFNISVSGQLEGIGATLQQKDGKIKVVSLVPGGPAWKQGDLEPGDVILKVAQGNKGKWISVIGMPLDEAVRLIRGKKGTKVRLMVEKQDGTIKEIAIIRDKIIIEETYVKSIEIIDTVHNFKIGYINIPSFYADFQKNSRKVSKDFLTEIQKLKKDNVNTIIVDLRNNGGGSLDEVVKMVGYFIERGPVVQVKGRNGNIREEIDRDRQIYFDGNVLVMTNYFSASASEIFASAMKDYKRALVFGTSHTHGKGTVQAVLNYDDIIYTSKKFKPLGAIKITISKFYRINGESTQLKGVIPDIIYPSVFSYVKTGERELKNALPWDTIQPTSYNTYNFSFIKDSVVNRSLRRIKADSFFIYASEYGKFIKKDQDNPLIPLNFDEYVKYQNEKRMYSKPFNLYKRKSTNLKFEFTSEDKKIMQTDSIYKMRYENWLKKLQKDHVLEEAFNVSVDMNVYKK